SVFFLTETASTDISTLSLHDALPIYIAQFLELLGLWITHGIIIIDAIHFGCFEQNLSIEFNSTQSCCRIGGEERIATTSREDNQDRKSTRLNSSHLVISYAVFCLKKK